MRSRTAIEGSKGRLDAPRSQVVRAADRLHRLTPEQRKGAVERAVARLKGRHPCRKDAATKAASD